MCSLEGGLRSESALVIMYFHLIAITIDSYTSMNKFHRFIIFSSYMTGE